MTPTTSQGRCECSVCTCRTQSGTEATTAPAPTRAFAATAGEPAPFEPWVELLLALTLALSWLGGMRLLLWLT
jgi:hypothetical protein